MSTDVLRDRAAELITLFGSVREAAGALGIDPAYLQRLSKGQKANPSAETLKKLGLRRTEIYERVSTKTFKATPLIPRTKSG